MNKIISIPPNNSFYSLHNVDNYKSQLQQTTTELIQKQNSLVIEYLRFISENIKLKSTSCNKFIIIRGLETVSHVFNMILYYSKNMELAFYHSQKAFYFYVEFIEQITDEQHTFLNLNSRDASLFVYKKTIFDINHDYRKSMNHSTSASYTEKLDMLSMNAKLLKQIVSLYIHNKDFVFNRDSLKKMIERTEKTMEHIKYPKLTYASYQTISLFMENFQTLSSSISISKYMDMIDLFLMKVVKVKPEMLKKINEKLNSFDFCEVDNGNGKIIDVIVTAIEFVFCDLEL